MADTLLVLSIIGTPPYSVRGISQSLEPISEAGNFQRTVNGALINLAPSQFKKYKSSISAKDIDPPAFGGLYPGQILTVDCVTELSFPTATGAADRTVVAGSLRTDSGFSFYRPQLSMMVVSFSETKDEWGAVVDWKLDLEEV